MTVPLFAGGCGYDTGANNGAMAWNIAINVTYGNWNIGSASLYLLAGGSAVIIALEAGLCNFYTGAKLDDWSYDFGSAIVNIKSLYPKLDIGIKIKN